MAIIYTYPSKGKVDKEDSFLITDSKDNNNTKNLPYESFLKDIQIAIKELNAASVSKIEYEPDATTEGLQGELRYWSRPANEGTSYMYLCTHASSYYFWMRIPLENYLPA